ncbi:hypothetical protein Micbo1qcDRAFT_230497 [Microdochium bolleyi]|uniref:Armadillo-type protein n=1 Tax=Microdochium bolleyi TaxID=196109 RepID=A0A136JDF9_9PEZI|nr:hypothetical protein Micbo1qcDRAFT_230497 [Microdochium bolleyi]
MALEAAFEAFRATAPSERSIADLSSIPNEVTLQDINELIRAHGQDDALNTLRTAQAVLDARPGLVSNASAPELLTETLSLLADVLKPDLDATQDGDHTNYDDLSLRASIGIDTIHLISSQDGVVLPPAAIIALAAYTNQDDRWSSPDLAESAQELLHTAFEDVTSGQRLQTLILDQILQALIRPLFSKSRPATVTASGRKAEFVQPSRYDNLDADAEAKKPWKYQQRYAITVFGWAVEQIDTETLRKNWHQFTPVLLTLLDDTSSTPLKLRALAIFQTFWAKCPSEIMRQTGLSQVFEDAIFPAVLYLPNLTPEDESVQVLNATYPALLAIVGGIDPDYKTSTPQSGCLDKYDERQRKLLHRIVREGILTAYEHSGEHIRIVEVLCRQLQCVVNGMGVLAVKHLKNMIPMLSAIISDPFATSHTPSLAAALDALSAVQATCWPRIPYYANNLIKTLMLCWISAEEAVEEREGEARKNRPSRVEMTTAADLRGIMDKLTHNAQMLDAILVANAADGEEAAATASSSSDAPAAAGKAARSSASAGKVPSVTPGVDGEAEEESPGFRATLAERVQPLVEKHASLGRLFLTSYEGA